MLGNDDEDLQRMAVNKLCSLQLKGPSYPIENDNLKEDLLSQVQFRQLQQKQPNNMPLLPISSKLTPKQI